MSGYQRLKLFQVRFPDNLRIRAISTTTSSSLLDSRIDVLGPGHGLHLRFDLILKLGSGKIVNEQQ